jgi:hypothetical protein
MATYEKHPVGSMLMAKPEALGGNPYGDSNSIAVREGGYVWRVHEVSDARDMDGCFRGYRYICTSVVRPDYDMYWYSEEIEPVKEQADG